MNRTKRSGSKWKIWMWITICGLVVAGFMSWDFLSHRRVERYVATGPEVPGVGISGGPPMELARYHKIRNALTRSMVQGDVRITLVWNTAEFFKALAEVESAQDTKNHETLYHAYAEKFGFQHDLVFTLLLDSRSLDLRAYSMKENSVLRNDKGVEVVPWHWLEASGSSSRHLEGVLFFPQRTESGTPMIGHLMGEHLPGESAPKFLDLILKGLPGGQEAIFRWELPPAAREAGS